MFDGFIGQHITTQDTTIDLVRGGRGSPLVLLHGYPQTHVCWHRVAHRMALDSAENITKLALLDIIPTSTAFAHVNTEMATAAFNWFFSIQPDGLPERFIGADPAFYRRWLLDHWCGTKGALAGEAVAEYQRCFDAAAIRATCEEFRAAATIDLIHDEADQAQKISCPTLLLWSVTSLWATDDMLDVWSSRAEAVQGVALECGHFLPEENPERTAAELIRFLS
jgi:haloacetate dehalogenase